MRNVNVYDLALHETIDINKKVTAMRVPGGWIYTIREVDQSPSQPDNFRLSSVFVKWSGELTYE